MPRTRSDASAYSLWGQASVSRGTSFGWVHGDRHEACHPHTSRFFPVLVFRLRRLNYEHPSFFFIRSYLLCLIRPALGGSARASHGAEVVIHPRGWIPPFGSRTPPDDLSRSERRARPDEWPTACESVRGPSPTSRLAHAGNDVVGARSSRPRPFSHSPPMGKSHATPPVVDVSRVVAIAGEAARALDPGQTAIFDRSGKDLTCWSPPTLQATDRAVGRSA